MQCAFSLLDLTLYHTLPPPWVHQNRTYPANMWLQFSNAVQGVDFPYVSKIQGPFEDRVLAVLTIFSLAIIENCSVLTSQFAVHAEGEKVGIIKDLRYWEAHSKAHSTDIVIWWKYLIETKLWMSECWLRCRFHSKESLRPSRGQSAQTLCSLSRAHTHTYINSHIYKHTNTHIYLYAHTCKHCYKTTTPKVLCALTETQNTLIQLSEKNA